MNVLDESVAREAREMLSRELHPTPLVLSSTLSHSNKQVFLKLESALPTGSFKIRGALYALWKKLKAERITEVVASSTGNHGAAAAFAANRFGVPATIFLPRNPNPVKRRKIAALSATIIEEGQDLAEAHRAAVQYCLVHGRYFLDDATDPDIPVGTATIAYEIIEQMNAVDEIYVPMGDTALIRGVAAAAKAANPEIRIVGVQAERAPAYYLSWQSGRVICTEPPNTIADGLATREPLSASVAMIRRLVDDIRLVTEEQMLMAIRHLILEEHVVAEAAGAATTAAYLMGDRRSESRNTVLVFSGANISPKVLADAVRMGDPGGR